MIPDVRDRMIRAATDVIAHYRPAPGNAIHYRQIATEAVDAALAAAIDQAIRDHAARAALVVAAAAERWHAASDHGGDGVPFGAPLCNCERIAARARALGWVS